MGPIFSSPPIPTPRVVVGASPFPRPGRLNGPIVFREMAPSSISSEGNPAARYEVLRQLGKGSYGTVFLVRERARQKMFCMKKIALQGLGARERQAAHLEVKLLRELKHPHVVSYHDSFLHKSANQLCLVMTFCEGGDLHGKVKARKKEGGRLFSEARVVSWLLQLTLALQYIHDRHSIIHRDLKTQNVFLMATATPSSSATLASAACSTRRRTSLAPAWARPSTCAPS